MDDDKHFVTFDTFWKAAIDAVTLQRKLDEEGTILEFINFFLRFGNLLLPLMLSVDFTESAEQGLLFANGGVFNLSPHPVSQTDIRAFCYFNQVISSLHL